MVPNLGYAADAHYHHLVDDVIVGGKMRYREGAIAVPTGPGLGVQLDREKLRQYHELFKELGGYPYDRDPGRPGWYPLVPNDRWADPGAMLMTEDTARLVRGWFDCQRLGPRARAGSARPAAASTNVRRTCAQQPA